jgi:hypothetical protein
MIDANCIYAVEEAWICARVKPRRISRSIKQLQNKAAFIQEIR